MYDVIVVGAGPAGSSASKELVDKGFKVLLVEKYKMPRNKSCSGLLIKKTLGLVQSYFAETIPQSVKCSPSDNKGMIFTDDDGNEYRYEQDGLNIWRSSFDHWLAQKAVEAGVELRDGTEALSCNEQGGMVSVLLKSEENYIEQAKVVIVCDGAAGTINRKILDKKQGYILTYQTFNKGTIDLDPHYFYAYLQPSLSEYDAWFNVKDDYLIFGVAVKDSGSMEHYYSQFESYMRQKHNARINVQGKSEKWIMPHITQGCPVDYGKGRILFAGEAAGFLNPMGEGISAGLESGYCAAKAIQKVDLEQQIDIQAVHAAYKEYVADLKKYMERQWLFLANQSDKFAFHRRASNNL